MITETLVAQREVSTVADEVIYTVPAGTRTFLKEISISNHNAVTIGIRVFLPASIGATAGGANRYLPWVAIPTLTLLQITGTVILLPGAVIRARTSHSDVTITISGAESTGP